MPNITEVIGLVSARLDRKSLLRCAVVNKQWYEVAMPLLFKVIPKLKTLRQQESFHRLVLEDYYLKEEQRLKKHRRKQRKKRKKRRQKKREHQPLRQFQLEAVDKSGDATQVQSAEKNAEKSESPKTRPQPSKDDPDAFDLLEQFLSQCSSLQLPKVVLDEDHFMNPDLLLLLSTYIVPVTEHLVITTEGGLSYLGLESDDSDDDSDDEITSIMRQLGHVKDANHSSEESAESRPMSTWNFKNFLASSSGKLEILSLDIDSWVADESDSEKEVDGRPEFLTGIKELRIINSGKTPEAIRCWDWLWKHAHSVQSLRIARIRKAFPQFMTSLIRGIAIYLHQLKSIHIGRSFANSWDDKVDFRDPIIARLLSAGHDYTSIYLDISARAGLVTVQAIPQHYSTLTEFTMEIGTGDDSFLVDIMVFSPNLSKLVTIKNSDTIAYRPWACEESLETLQIKIDGIPFMGDEKLPMHHKVYGRLARLTNLQVLWLGHTPTIRDGESAGGETEGDVQEECLQMTLESGLAALGTLTKLRQLNLFDVYHDIGVADIRWMVESWPRLEKIWGLYDEGRPASDWLQEHHPSLLGTPTDMPEEEQGEEFLSLSEEFLSSSEESLAK
ncbi:hypothetical protein BGZ82_003344 [Podila clonocystis]|nr:hypothetical protein BGZ82_003344 [Podila clonocystis]